MISKKEKEQRNFVILLICLGIFFISFGVAIIIYGRATEGKNTVNKLEKPNLTDEEEGELVSSLMDYGIKMYEDKSYLTFEEIGDSYYITLGELKKKGHTEIEKMVYSCTDEDPIIYFYKNVEDFEFYPIVVSYYCGEYEMKE